MASTDAPTPSVAPSPVPIVDDYYNYYAPTVPTSSPVPSSSPVPTIYYPPSTYHPPSYYDANSDYYRSERIRFSLIIIGIVAFVGVMAAGVCASRRQQRDNLERMQRQQQLQQEEAAAALAASEGAPSAATVASAAGRAGGSGGGGAGGEGGSVVPRGGNNNNDADNKERRLWLAQWLAPVQLVLAPQNFPKSPPGPSSAAAAAAELERMTNATMDVSAEAEAEADPAGRGPLHGPASLRFTVEEDKILIPAPGLFVDNDSENDDQREQPGSTMGAVHPRPSPRLMRWASGSCTICLMTYQIGESVTWSSNPECEHCFHTNCIEAWLLKRRKLKKPPGRTGTTSAMGRDGETVPLCPNCRREFVKDPFDEARASPRDPRARALDEISV